MNIKYKLLTIITTFLTVFFTVNQITKATTEIYFFYGTGCPHCAVVESFLKENNLYEKYPVVEKEVYSSRENAKLYVELMDERDIPDNQRGVPAMVLGTTVLIGDKPIIDNFILEADKYISSSTSQEITNVENETIQETTTAEIIPAKKTDLTFAAVIAASIVDAINPCAFAVLIILMSTILLDGNNKKALKSGLAFATSIFISYFLMGLGLYKALELGGISAGFFKIIGGFAIILGLLNLKDWLWYGKGFLMEVPLSWRPNLKKLIKSVTNPIGAFGIGFLISLFLLPCTSGPYIVILGMLANKTLQTKAVLYLVLYNLIFVSPMILISYAVSKGFDPSKAEQIRQKRLKTLHLVAGVVMLVMGIVILNGWI